MDRNTTCMFMLWLWVYLCIIAKKQKKGMATAKQRLGKKLKIHKMIFWVRLRQSTSNGYVVAASRDV